ncbi:MAG TPA: CAP domain-containing protein [Pyrinomonadaceae bacterium]
MWSRRSLLVLLLLITCRSAFAQDPGSMKPTDIEKRAFEQTNLERIKNGLPPFVWDADICRMARTHSENMAQQRYFSHVTPEGLRLRDRARAAGILRYSVLGENIAYNQGYTDPGGLAVERWMLSPKHRANILSPEFRAMAIGSFVAADGSVYLTQTFITR